MSNNTFGMDLGTNNIKIYNKVEDSFFIEKNMIAIENKNTLLAYGDSAFEMYEKAPANIRTSYPVCNGVIADINNMETLVKYFISDQSKGTLKPSDFYVAVPTDVTEVEKRAFYDLIKDAGVKARKIMVVEKAVADGLGLGIDVKNSQGVLVVNVGYAYSPLPHPNSKTIGLSFLKKSCFHLPFNGKPSVLSLSKEYSKRLGKVLFSAKRSNLFFLPIAFLLLI